MKFWRHHFKFCTKWYANFSCSTWVHEYRNCNYYGSMALTLLFYGVGGCSNGWLELIIFVFKALFIKINQYLSSKQRGHGSFIIRPWKTKLSQNQKPKNCKRVIYINQTKPSKRIKIDCMLGWYSYYIHVNDYFYINLRFMWP